MIASLIADALWGLAGVAVVGAAAIAYVWWLAREGGGWWLGDD